MQEKDDILELPAKIARLVEERGWNQEEFARISGLNRHTARQILKPDGPYKMRNATVSSCARALGLSVNDLRTQPVEKLLESVAEAMKPRESGEPLRRLYEEATQPELLAWIERNPERARSLSREEVEELLGLQGPGGPISAFGVSTFIERFERRRTLLERVHAIAGTEYLDLLEQFVELVHDKIQSYPARNEEDGEDSSDSL